MKTSQTHQKQLNPLFKFFLLTFSISWAAWIPLAAPKREVSLTGEEIFPLALLLLGAFAPSLVGTMLSLKGADRFGRRDFWRRVIDPRLISPGWAASIVMLFPAIMAVSFAVDSLFGGEAPEMGSAFHTLLNPAALITFIITMLIGGPLAEELGWRGFALDGLLKNYSPLRSSLVLGLIHAAWHLPLFFINGTSQGTMGIGSSLFWLWVIQVVAGSAFFTWVYLNNNRSIFSAVLVHFMSNATFTFVAQLGNALPLQLEIIRTFTTILLITLILVFKPVGRKNLRSAAQLG